MVSSKIRVNQRTLEGLNYYERTDFKARDLLVNGNSYENLRFRLFKQFLSLDDRMVAI
jgi:hypothetical protein